MRSGKKGVQCVNTIFKVLIFSPCVSIQALGRLSERESYDRAFRLKQAIQLSLMHRELPKEQWTKPEQVRAFW
jgi:hypothetical protein